MRSNSSSLIIVGAMVASLWGCGGKTDTTNCGKVSACGGNLLGAWKLVTACGSVASTSGSTVSGTSCAGETTSVSDYQVVGSLTFRSDMTYSIDLQSLTETVNATIPQSCLGGGLTCAAENAQLMQQSGATGADGGVALISGSCTGTTTCNCTATVSINAMTMNSGTYSTSGSTLTMVTTSGGTSTVGYCVQGSTLHIVGGATGTTGQGASGTDLIAEKE